LQSCLIENDRYDFRMRDLAILIFHLIATGAKLCRRGGARSIVAESLLLKHQLLILNRSRGRAPNLRPTDRLIAALCADWLRPDRLLRAAIVIRPSTIMSFHRALVNQKYRWLFTPKSRGKPGPKGPSEEVIAAIVEMKRKNPRFGCRRIAQQLSFVFGFQIDKDVVRRVLAKHYRPDSGAPGPSWLTFLGHSKDSLWSLDLFRCESLFLRTHWVMVIMDQFNRRIIGFAVHGGPIDGPGVCRLFGNAISGNSALPRRLSTDHDPLFEYRQWKANLRILEISEVKTVPYVPLSHPFVERLIGTIRRELLDQIPFWTAGDLERKLEQFKDYYNRERVHASLGGISPDSKTGAPIRESLSLARFRWKSHCRGLYQLPAAA
jgi:putative transposase